MKINFKKSLPLKETKGAAVIIIDEDSCEKSNLKYVKYAKENLDFKAKFACICLLSESDRPLLLVGSGKADKFDDKKATQLGGKIASALNSSKIKEATVIFDENANDLAFGALLQSYRFNKYFVDKKKDKDFRVKTINFATKNEKSAKESFKDQEILAKNVFFTRDLVSEPANILNPESYAEICAGLKKDGLEVEILGEKEMQKLGMNSLLAVGQGSSKESKLVILKHNGGKKGEKPVAFVGKGVTFDTGGISIKPSNNMEDMKTDMGGSAVVVGLLRNLAQRKAKLNAVGVVGLVENMPSGTAQRPSDVVTSMSGQTIEVINTDAEGRMVLADALHYTNTKFEPKIIVDLATLTGAIIVALADIHAGLFSNDDELSAQLEKAGQASSETVWRLPVSKEYDEMINSEIADMKNVGAGRGAGSTTAAQFLHRFVGKTKWAHLDIAGVAWKGKGDAFAVKGATGYGVRLLDRLVRDNYEG